MSDPLRTRFRTALHDTLGDLTEGSRLAVAVSGGGDSLALLLLAHEILPVHAVTLDHGLRAEAADEAREVAAICARLGIQHTTLTWQHDPTDAAGNLMARARRARYQLLAGHARAQGISHIALGHTEDDVAETFLMRLQRKSGLDGLAAMRARWTNDGVTFFRPLLAFRRAELRDYLREIGQVWIEDPTNDDPTYDRSKIRQALVELTKLGISPAEIAASARHLAAAQAVMADMCLKFTTSCLKEATPNLLRFDHASFTGGPDDMQRQLLAHAICYLSQSDYAPRAEKVEHLRRNVLERRKSELAHCKLVHEGADFILLADGPPAGERAQGGEKDFLTAIKEH